MQGRRPIFNIGMRTTTFAIFSWKLRTRSKRILRQNFLNRKQISLCHFFMTIMQILGCDMQFSYFSTLIINEGSQKIYTLCTDKMAGTPCVCQSNECLALVGLLLLGCTVDHWYPNHIRSGWVWVHNLCPLNWSTEIVFHFSTTVSVHFNLWYEISGWDCSCSIEFMKKRIISTTDTSILNILIKTFFFGFISMPEKKTTQYFWCSVDVSPTAEYVSFIWFVSQN